LARISDAIMNTCTRMPTSPGLSCAGRFSIEVPMHSREIGRDVKRCAQHLPSPPPRHPQTARTRLANFSQ
jgi:hypothetical protein